MVYSSAEEIREYLTDLDTFIENEAAAKRAEIQDLREKPVSERVELARAISGAEVVEHTGPARWLLKFPGNDSRFREGDMICLSDGVPNDFVWGRGSITRIEDTELEIETTERRFSSGQTGVVIDEDFLDLSAFYKKALESAATSHRGTTRILPLLMKKRYPSGPSSADLAFKTVLVREGFNSKQAEAIVYATSTDLCHLIQGPPGTGKTRVLARIVERILEKDQQARILVTSFTHRAIDNCLEALLKSVERVRDITAKIARGKPDISIPWYQKFSDTPWAKKEGGPYVIGATPFAHQTRLEWREFDWVIVDEASQVTRALAVMAMLAGDRWVFAGDHKQMPPVTLTKSPGDAIEESVFGTLASGGFNTMLDVTYRMNAGITSWPSAEFYEGNLVPGKANATAHLKLPSLPIGFEEIFSADYPVVFVQLTHSGRKSVAPEEVRLLADLIAALDSVEFSFKQLGIVVPFRRQARALRNELIRRNIAGEKLRGLVADTVERMQGQEREIVMVSLTTSDPGFADRIGNFLFQPERLNVAITRPKTKLVVIGSEAWINIFPQTVTAKENALVFKRFLESCHIVKMPI